MDEISTKYIIHPELNPYPDEIEFDSTNYYLRSPYAPFDLPFYQTRDTIQNVDGFRNFLKSAESAFRASKEYKIYKAFIIEYVNKCQIFGNISGEDATLELHHNVIGLFDICLLIALHMINTVGILTTYDLVQLLIIEHNNNRVGVTFLCKTAHQMFTNDPDGYIPPDMTLGRWWELLSIYRYGITYELANKVIKYIQKYQNDIPVSINLEQQEQILGFAFYNEYGTPRADCGYLPGKIVEVDDNGKYNEFESFE